jgi:glycolate oxidase FAD binding subunit
VSATQVSDATTRELRVICGDENTRERPNGGVYVSPASAEEVAAVLTFANEHGLSVGPAGGSTERSAAELRTDIVLHLNQLTQIEHYDCGDLTVGVGAGTTIAQLNEMVSADKLMFAGDPPSPERCTVGGLLATASHGPLRHGYGAVRDYCIGVRFVTGDGRRAKGGGRVVKNVAGYDMMKLLIGSYGTLAVITSASLKLFPAPRQTRTFLAEFMSANEALQFRDRVMRSPLSPMCLELVSPGARKIMRPEMTSDAWVICVRTSGSDNVLARYRKELGSAISREAEGEDERRMWRAIENFPPSRYDLSGTELNNISLQRVHMTMPSNEVSAAIEILEEYSSHTGFEVGIIGRVGLGHLLAAGWPMTRDSVLSSQAKLSDLRNRLRSSFSVKAEGAANPWPNPTANIASMRAVKQALDPKNILRGREIF